MTVTSPLLQPSIYPVGSAGRGNVLSSYRARIAAPANMVAAPYDFTAASWSKVRATVDGDAIAGPAGAPGDKVTCSTTGGGHVVLSGSAGMPVGARLRLATCVKRGVGDWVVLASLNGAMSNAARIWFDLLNGAVGTTSTAGTGWSVVPASARIQPVGQGYFLLHAEVATAVDSDARFYLAGTSANGAFSSVAGDHFAVWGGALSVAQ